MSRFGAPEKDRDAATLIDRNVRAMPDAPYMLVQSVLVQEHALQQADERIRDLEAQVRDLERGQAQTSSGGSFLGGLFGGSRPAPAQERRPSPSVPAMGSRPGAPQWFVMRDGQMIAWDAGLSAWRRTVWPTIRKQTVARHTG